MTLTQRDLDDIRRIVREGVGRVLLRQDPPELPEIEHEGFSESVRKVKIRFAAFDAAEHPEIPDAQLDPE